MKNSKIFSICIGILFILFCFQQTIVAQTGTQTDVATQSVFVELGGCGLIATFNYDVRLSGNQPDGIGIRAGLGGLAIGDFTAFTAPVNLNYLLGKNGKYFEVGAGVTYSSIGFFGEDDEEFSEVLGNLVFGYRSQPVDGGFTFRASLTPLFGTIDDGSGSDFYFIPYFGGISFGYAF